MCVLCGDLVTQVHWTDQQIKENDETIVIVGGTSQRVRMRNRLHRMRLINKILAFYGLTVEDWNGSKYILRDGKGNTEIVQDLGQIWYTAEKILHRTLDPLQLELQIYLDHNEH